MHELCVWVWFSTRTSAFQKLYNTIQLLFMHLDGDRKTSESKLTIHQKKEPNKKKNRKREKERGREKLSKNSEKQQIYISIVWSGEINKNATLSYTFHRNGCMQFMKWCDEKWIKKRISIKNAITLQTKLSKNERERQRNRKATKKTSY